MESTASRANAASAHSRAGRHPLPAAAVAVLTALLGVVAEAGDPPGPGAVNAPASGEDVRSAPPEPKSQTFRATAYALEGTTASGTIARPGIVAADPAVLPLGSRIRITGAGKYSGEYLVEDTGPKVRGHMIDIKMSTVAEARQFGHRRVQVQVLSRGTRKP